MVGTPEMMASPLPVAGARAQRPSGAEGSEAQVPSFPQSPTPRGLSLLPRWPPQGPPQPAALQSEDLQTPSTSSGRRGWQARAQPSGPNAAGVCTVSLLEIISLGHSWRRVDPCRAEGQRKGCRLGRDTVSEHGGRGAEAPQTATRHRLYRVCISFTST